MEGTVQMHDDTKSGVSSHQSSERRGDASTDSPSIRNTIKDLISLEDLKYIVKLPEGEDENEWIAVHISDFHNQVSLLYATMEEYCTEATCPTMNAGPKYEYLWADNEHPEPVKVSAHKYVGLLLRWVSGYLKDPAVFPSLPGAPFPDNFKIVASRIFKRMLRVYAHIYHCHWEVIRKLGQQNYLEICTKHFVLFGREFNLIDSTDLDPIKQLIDKWFKQ